MQWDTSEHDWLEGRDENRYLIGMIDDASSELLAGFAPHDSSEENRHLLKDYPEKNGRPAAFYTDRPGLWRRSHVNVAGRSGSWRVVALLVDFRIGRVKILYSGSAVPIFPHFPPLRPYVPHTCLECGRKVGPGKKGHTNIEW